MGLQQLHKVASGEPLVAQEVIRLARLCCNSAHELQNLSVAPKNGAGTDAHKTMKDIDNIAGKCESASRAIMVLAHRWHITGKARPTSRIAHRATFLVEAVQQCNRLLQRTRRADAS